MFVLLNELWKNPSVSRRPVPVFRRYPTPLTFLLMFLRHKEGIFTPLSADGYPPAPRNGRAVPSLQAGRVRLLGTTPPPVFPLSPHRSHFLSFFKYTWPNNRFPGPNGPPPPLHDILSESFAGFAFVLVGCGFFPGWLFVHRLFLFAPPFWGEGPPSIHSLVIFTRFAEGADLFSRDCILRNISLDCR